jgi:hypothetical protein
MFPEAGGAVTPTAGGLLTSFSTTFPDDEDPLSPLIWDNGLDVGLGWNNMLSSNGNATGKEIQTGFNDNLAALRRWVLTDYFVEGIVHRGPGYNPSINHEAILFVRLAVGPDSAVGIEVLFSAHGNSEIVQWLGGVGQFQQRSQVGDQALQDNDVIRAEVEGNTITAFRNAQQVHQVTEATFAATGAPGLGAFSVGGGSPPVVLANLGWKSITAGPL